MILRRSSRGSGIGRAGDIPVSRGAWLRSERAKAEDFRARGERRASTTRCVVPRRWHVTGGLAWMAVAAKGRGRSALARAPTPMGAERLTVQARSPRLLFPRRLGSAL